MIRKLAFLLALLSSLPLTAEELQRYLVTTRKGASPSRLRVAATAMESAERATRSFANVETFAANLTASEAAELNRTGDLVVEPVVSRHVDSLDFDSAPDGFIEEPGPPQELPWGITNIHAPQVWPHSRGENVNVVVVDTGIDADHPDLKHAYQGGYNAFDPAKLPIDLHRHGTHVAGTIAAADDAFGVVGVAPKVKLWAVKVLDDEGDGTSETVIAALDWVVAKSKELGGRWVVNMSLGSSVGSDVEESAISRVNEAGIVVVSSAGNRGTNSMRYPASYKGVIAVGAADRDGKRAPFSNYGHYMTFMAPGVDVRSSVIQGLKVSADAKTTGGETLAAWQIVGSPFAVVRGRIYDCAQGDPESFPPGVVGNIALIRRGKYTFREMARNAKHAGAIALVIETYPNRPGVDAGGWSFFPNPAEPEWEGYAWPLAIGVKATTGTQLLAQPGEVTIGYRSDRYGSMQGTSMAAPHVTGTVALLLSLAPDLPVSQVEYVLRATTREAGAPGWDYDTGWGLVDALKAAEWVAYEKFGVPAPTPAPATRRRSVR